jgi:hypothetical protein
VKGYQGDAGLSLGVVWCLYLGGEHW